MLKRYRADQPVGTDGSGAIADLPPLPAPADARNTKSTGHPIGDWERNSPDEGLDPPLLRIGEDCLVGISLGLDPYC